MLMCVGLPGSGKSTFSQQLEQCTGQDTIGWVRASQDDLKSRDACEALVVRTLLKQGSTARLVLDRACVDPEERAIWLNIAQRPKTATAVFFDIPAQICKERVSLRKDHPTIRFGGGQRVVDELAKKLIPPAKAEGFAEIVTIRSLEDMNALLVRFGATPIALSKLEASSTSDDGETDEYDNGDDASSDAVVPAASAASSAPESQLAAKAMPVPATGKGKSAARSHDANSEATHAQTLENFHKFPRTYHLFDAGGSGVARDDLVMDGKEPRRFFDGKTIIALEEKVDGANLGISIDPERGVLCQNRAHYVNSATHKQFATLDTWIQAHEAELREILEPGRHILFGEWLYAMHSIHYTRLPSYFIAFDIFDVKEQKFYSRRRRDAFLQATTIPIVRLVAERTFKSKDEIKTLLMTTRSQYHDGNVEGLYMRIDNDVPQQQQGAASASSSKIADTDCWNVGRCKVVRPDFIQGITEQWTRKTFVKNMVEY
ncbi:DNA ligase III [Capsaspora owczarzaki ATCC 30864]|uniref:DNA ligase III n=2 Tax=Capsaspora owczarzaki (strain ATCC 30864) TaxID=595528 RepID=A0A0D2X188_CAPO3|nr:DNA ligase III [Capsaspora owczarzaki ATCC 30864]